MGVYRSVFEIYPNFVFGNFLIKILCRVRALEKLFNLNTNLELSRRIISFIKLGCLTANLMSELEMELILAICRPPCEILIIEDKNNLKEEPK